MLNLIKKFFILIFIILSQSTFLFAWQSTSDYDLIGEINFGGVSDKINSSYESEGALNVFVSTSSETIQDLGGGLLPNVNNLANSILTEPLDELSTSYTKPTFKWAFSDPDSNPQRGFKVELSLNSDFSSIDYTSGETESSAKFWTPSIALGGGTYYWRVKVKDDPWDEWGHRCSTRTIIISPNASPFAPSSLSQADGINNDNALSWNSWTNDTTPRLKFTLNDPDAGQNLRYRIQISTQRGSFSPQYLVVDATLPSVGWLKAGATWYDTTLTQNTSYWWRVNCIDDSSSASSFSSGTISGSQVHFGLDLVSPARIADLRAVTGFYPGEIKLTWTSPGDDNNAKQIVNGAYRIRYSTYVTLSSDYWTDTAANWTSFTNKYQITWSTNTSANSVQTRTLTGLTYNTTYFIRIWTRDEIGSSLTSWAGNWAPISIGATTWAEIPIYGVDVDVSILPFGGLPVSSCVVSGQIVTVTNTGNMTENYSLRVTSTPFWSVDQNTPGNDTISLQAKFNTVRPSTAAFSGALHGMTTTYQLCGTSGGKFAGDQTGANVSPNQQTKIWYLMKTPTSTTTTLEQSINFYITAGP